MSTYPSWVYLLSLTPKEKRKARKIPPHIWWYVNNLYLARNNMAKPYRQAPLIGADEASGLPLQQGRTQKSAELLGRMTARFDEEFIFHVASEIGLDECLSYSGNGTALEYDLTALQLVSLSSALAACAEYRDAMEPQSETYRCRRCRHSWRAKREPVKCPSCKSSEWNTRRERVK